MVCGSYDGFCRVHVNHRKICCGGAYHCGASGGILSGCYHCDGWNCHSACQTACQTRFAPPSFAWKMALAWKVQVCCCCAHWSGAGCHCRCFFAPFAQPESGVTWVGPLLDLELCCYPVGGRFEAAEVEVWTEAGQKSQEVNAGGCHARSFPVQGGYREGQAALVLVLVPCCHYGPDGEANPFLGRLAAVERRASRYGSWRAAGGPVETVEMAAVALDASLVRGSCDGRLARGAIWGRDLGLSHLHGLSRLHGLHVADPIRRQSPARGQSFHQAAGHDDPTPGQLACEGLGSRRA